MPKHENSPQQKKYDRFYGHFSNILEINLFFKKLIEIFSSVLNVIFQFVVIGYQRLKDIHSFKPIKKTDRNMKQP